VPLEHDYRAVMISPYHLCVAGRADYGAAFGIVCLWQTRTGTAGAHCRPIWPSPPGKRITSALIPCDCGSLHAFPPAFAAFSTALHFHSRCAESHCTAGHDVHIRSMMLSGMTASVVGAGLLDSRTSTGAVRRSYSGRSPRERSSLKWWVVSGF